MQGRLSSVKSRQGEVSGAVLAGYEKQSYAERIPVRARGSRMLLMLEDDAERVGRFKATLKRIDPGLPLRVWRNAWTMIREVESCLPEARLISLDHDLDPEKGDPNDPGTGWDLVKFLAVLPATCPVIIHTSNRERSDWMCGELELGGWKYYRVAPIGDDWIEQHWRPIARRLLKVRKRR
jgi:hypothetical protein